METPKKELTREELSVIRLYVLLDRIGKVEDFIWRGMDIKEQKEEFKKVFGKLPENKYRDLFLNESILQGKISNEYRRDKTVKQPFRPPVGTTSIQDLTLPGAIDETVPGEATYTPPDDASTSEQATLNKGSILPGAATSIKDETILHRAISLLPAKRSQLMESDDEEKINKTERENTDLEEIINLLFEKVPFLVKYIRSESDYEGQTPLHVAVMKENSDIVKKIVKTIQTLDGNPESIEANSLLNQNARGLRFRNTAMLAGTPLGVAALTFNKEIFNHLIENNCDIDRVNEESDNVFHSLIKYAYCRNDLIEKVLKMMDYIAHCQWPKDGYTKDELQQEDRVTGLWMTYNKKKKTPLQLTVKLGMPDIFTRIMSYKVYCFNTDGDVGNDSTTWDITDIETAPQWSSRSNKKKDKADPAIQNLNDMSKQYHILRAIMKQKSPKTAYAFIRCAPVGAVIDEKWKVYKWIFLVMGLIHFTFMCLLSSSGIMRSKMYNQPYNNPDETTTDPPRFIYSVADAPTLISMNIASGTFVLYGLIGVLVSFTGIKKCNCNIESWFKRQVANPYSNSIFKLFAYLMNGFLLADIVAAYTSDLYEHQSLMFALIVGWYLELFFLQAIKPLSFFAALIQKVVLDMIRFTFFIGILLVAFSSVMFMIMQGANTDDDAFEEFPQTILRMLNIMLGLGDIDALLKTRHPAGAAIVYVLFVLLTTILLLNALIAMMSNTCTELMSDRGRILATDYHYNLQKLSVVVFLETVLPKCWYKVVGSVKNRFWFKHDKTVNQNKENGQIQNGKWYVTERLIWKQESTIDVDNGGVYEADDTLVSEVSFKALKTLFNKDSKPAAAARGKTMHKNENGVKVK